MMEVLRIIKASGLRPRRTIRIGLWGAEEGGLIGSRFYATEHLAAPRAVAAGQAERGGGCW